jgi:transposase
LTLAELAAKHGVHQTMIGVWKMQAIEGMAASFLGKPEAAAACSAAGVDQLHAKIEQLVVERDFLAKALSR